MIFLTKKIVVVKNRDGEERVVQAAMIPDGFEYVEDYKEPKQVKKPTEKKDE